MATSANKKLLSLENMNPNVIKMEYAVRGPLVIRAAEIEKEMKEVSRVFFLLCCGFAKKKEVKVPHFYKLILIDESTTLYVT